MGDYLGSLVAGDLLFRVATESRDLRKVVQQFAIYREGVKLALVVLPDCDRWDFKCFSFFSFLVLLGARKPVQSLPKNVKVVKSSPAISFGSPKQ